MCVDMYIHFALINFGALGVENWGVLYREEAGVLVGMYENKSYYCPATANFGFTVCL